MSLAVRTANTRVTVAEYTYWSLMYLCVPVFQHVRSMDMRLEVRVQLSGVFSPSTTWSLEDKTQAYRCGGRRL